MDSVPAHVESLIAASLDCSVSSVEVPADGRIGETYLLELADTPWQAVCKIGGPSVRTGDVIEPLATQLVNSTTELPVPSVLATGVFDEETGFQKHWAVYEHREGVTPTPFDARAVSVRRRILSETGAILGQLHAKHQFDRLGGLGRSADTLCICDPDGLNFPKRGRELVGITPTYRDRDRVPVLSHGDLFPGNLLVDKDGTVTALLDWGNAQVTTASYALARAEMRFVDWFQFPAKERKRLRSALRRGYRQHRPLPAEYPELASFYKAVWLAQSADRVCRHLLSRRGRQQMKRHLASLVPV
ncbi:phosphotransferase family protein [Halovenus rubra]|uniref:Phosphotransferase family protein n=2 Tax=Halovenus rubra TaxID=869890 RepID=A0ABD5X889_9EURY|nr:aminoglycoside phosphotransferase family protein [Halovenus rubra]